MAACFAAAIVGAVTANLRGWWWLVLSAVAAVATFKVVNSQKAELVATRLEFTTTGDLGRRVQTPRIVFTADIRGLEFRGEVGPFTHKLDGLYAVTERKEVCVLPFLDWEQTQQVIREIEKKFPGLAQHWREHSSAVSYPGL